MLNWRLNFYLSETKVKSPNDKQSKTCKFREFKQQIRHMLWKMSYQTNDILHFRKSKKSTFVSFWSLAMARCFLRCKKNQPGFTTGPFDFSRSRRKEEGNPPTKWRTILVDNSIIKSGQPLKLNYISIASLSKNSNHNIRGGRTDKILVVCGTTEAIG